jgi:hypothetical protein
MTAFPILAHRESVIRTMIPSELTHGPESAKKIASAVIESIPDLRITQF